MYILRIIDDTNITITKINISLDYGRRSYYVRTYKKQTARVSMHCIPVCSMHGISKHGELSVYDCFYCHFKDHSIGPKTSFSLPFPVHDHSTPPKPVSLPQHIEVCLDGSL